MAVVQTQSWSWSSAVRQTNTHQLRQINLQTRLEPANHLKMVLVLVWCTCVLYGMCTAIRCCSRPSLGHLVQGKLLSDIKSDTLALTKQKITPDKWCKAEFDTN